MKKKANLETMEEILIERENEIRTEMLGFIEEGKYKNYNRETQLMIATRQGRLMELKEIRVRFRNETGTELKGTKAPKDVRK